MKPATKEWITFAEEDLLAAKRLSGDIRLTNIVAFHCQQCLEKCFKAILEESEFPVIKSHDLLKLRSLSEIHMTVDEIRLLRVLNEVYIDSRYPGDFGLLPDGKPTISEVDVFIAFASTVLENILIQKLRLP